MGVNELNVEVVHLDHVVVLAKRLGVAHQAIGTDFLGDVIRLRPAWGGREGDAPGEKHIGMARTRMPGWGGEAVWAGCVTCPADQGRQQAEERRKSRLTVPSSRSTAPAPPGLKGLVTLPGSHFSSGCKNHTHDCGAEAARGGGKPTRRVRASSCSCLDDQVGPK